MASKAPNENISTNLVQCQYHPYGCTHLFPQNECLTHYTSETHIESLINFICSQKLNYDCALIDHMVIPMGAGALSSQPTIRANDYLRFFEQLTTFMVETVPSSNPATIASNQPYNSINVLSRNLIQRMDRASNRGSDLQALQDERQLNETTMNGLSNRITNPSSNEDHENRGREQDQDPPQVGAQNTTELQSLLDVLREIELRAKPVSDYGIFNWSIKIKDAVNGKRPFIDSLPFRASANGDRLFARLYFKGKTDRRFVSLYVHLNFPVHATFHGIIKLILVDQSTNDPLQHFVTKCSGEMVNVNDCLGFDNFIDNKMLLKQGNRYVLGDSIYLVIYVKEIDREKYAHLPPNVQNALKESF